MTSYAFTGLFEPTTQQSRHFNQLCFCLLHPESTSVNNLKLENIHKVKAENFFGFISRSKASAVWQFSLEKR